MDLKSDRAASSRPDEWPDERASCAEDEWLDRCLDEGSVLHCRLHANGTAECDEDRLDWLVPDRDGNGYVVVAGVRASDDMIGVVLFDD